MLLRSEVVIRRRDYYVYGVCVASNDVEGLPIGEVDFSSFRSCGIWQDAENVPFSAGIWIVGITRGRVFTFGDPSWEFGEDPAWFQTDLESLHKLWRMNLRGKSKRGREREKLEEKSEYFFIGNSRNGRIPCLLQGASEMVEIPGP